MSEEGVIKALSRVLAEQLEKLEKGLSNWMTAQRALLSDFQDIARMFRCYEVTEALAMLVFARAVLADRFVKVVVEESLERLKSDEYRIPEPFKSMFEREVHRLSIDHFDEDLIPVLSKLGESLASVRLLLEASKVYRTAHEYHLLKLLIDSSQPAIEELNNLFKSFLRRSIDSLQSNSSPEVIRDVIREFVKEIHRKTYGWP